MRAVTMMQAYRSLFSELSDQGVEELNDRTKTKIMMLRGGHSFKLNLNNRIPIAGNRKFYPHIAAAETAWQFMGTKDPAFILKKAPKLWSKFVENGELKTAYGYRWRKAFGRDQLELAVKELRDNPTNRQIWVQAWDPSNDGLGGEQPKNIPCPIGFAISRYKNSHVDELHMSVFIRSSDVFVGLPYDVMSYALTLDAIAATVGCIPKTIHFTLAHPHLYEPHWDAVTACTVGFSSRDWQLNKKYEDASIDWTENCEPSLPAWTIEEILHSPDDYCTHVQRSMSRVNNNPWDPMPVVIE